MIATKAIILHTFGVQVGWGPMRVPVLSVVASSLEEKVSSIFLGDTMAPHIEQDYILLLGYSILYQEYDLAGFNHQKTPFR